MFVLVPKIRKVKDRMRPRMQMCVSCQTMSSYLYWISENGKPTSAARCKDCYELACQRRSRKMLEKGQEEDERNNPCPKVEDAELFAMLAEGGDESDDT